MSIPMVDYLANNQDCRLRGLAKSSATAALSLELHRFSFLAGADAVAVTFKHSLGNPTNDRGGVLRAVKLLQKLCFKLIDV